MNSKVDRHRNEVSDHNVNVVSKANVWRI
jgi:hypothetical protein